MSYEIITAVGSGEFFGRAAGDWESVETDEFPTIEGAIREIRSIGEEWANAIYAIREVGERYPVPGTVTGPEPR